MFSVSSVSPSPGTVVEIHRTKAHAAHRATERGVIIHSAMTWLVAFFPGDPDRPADPADPASIRIVPTAEVTAYRDLADYDPAWVHRTWTNLAKAGPGLLQAPHAVRVWELAATLAQHRLEKRAAPLITREQLECWAGRSLTDDDLERLGNAIPHSCIPETIDVLANEAIVRFCWNDHSNDLGDWCPHSAEPAPEPVPVEPSTGTHTGTPGDRRCPAGCRSSWAEPA